MKRSTLLLPAIASILTCSIFADSSSTAPQSEKSILFPKDSSKAPAKEEAQEEKKEPKVEPLFPQDSQEPVHIPTYGGTMTKMILTLLGLVAMVFLTVWMLKRLTQGRLGSFGKKNINILERRPLSPKTILYVVEFSGKQILVAESQLEVKTLSQADIITTS